MKYWKNITIDLPEMNLKNAMDKLLEINIVSVTILDKRQVKDSNWFHDHTKPLFFSILNLSNQAIPVGTVPK